MDQGYQTLSSGFVDLTVQEAHGNATSSGHLNIPWIESHPVNTFFYWSDGCAVGDIDSSDNFLSSILYSPTSRVLVARGSTNDSGGMGTNSNGSFSHNIATSLANGNNMGQAILDHVNVPLIKPWSSSREFQLAPNIVLGDPTLKLRESIFKGENR